MQRFFNRIPKKILDFEFNTEKDKGSFFFNVSCGFEQQQPLQPGSRECNIGNHDSKSVFLQHKNQH